MPDDLLTVAGQALQLAFWISIPVLAAAWLAGLVTAGFASFTRLGDASTATVPRQLAVALALWLSAAWAANELLAFTLALWARLGAPSGP